MSEEVLIESLAEEEESLVGMELDNHSSSGGNGNVELPPGDHHVLQDQGDVVSRTRPSSQLSSGEEHEEEISTSNSLTSTSSPSKSSDHEVQPRAKRRLTECEGEEEEDKGQNIKESSSGGGGTSSVPSEPSCSNKPFSNGGSSCREMNEYEVYAMGVEEAMQRLIQYLENHSKIIEKWEDGKAAVEEMLEDKNPVAVDCEGVNLGDKKNGEVTLVQVSNVRGTVYLFDVQVEPQLGEELKRLLESEDVVKVMHDCKPDSQGLFKQFGIKVKNVFDTQVAHRIIQKRNKPPNEKEDINAGLDKVCRLYGGAPSPFKDSIKNVYRKQQNYWTVRPLTPLMISYAASDVLCLVPYVYETLNSQITLEEERTLLMQLCENKLTLSEDNESSLERDKSKKKGKGKGGYNNHYNNNRNGRPGRGGRSRERGKQQTNQEGVVVRGSSREYPPTGGSVNYQNDYPPLQSNQNQGEYYGRRGPNRRGGYQGRSNPNSHHYYSSTTEYYNGSDPGCNGNGNNGNGNWRRGGGR